MDDPSTWQDSTLVLIDVCVITATIFHNVFFVNKLWLFPYFGRIVNSFLLYILSFLSIYLLLSSFVSDYNLKVVPYCVRQNYMTPLVSFQFP